MTLRKTIRKIMDTTELTENDKGHICKKEFSPRGKETISVIKSDDGRDLLFPTNKNLKDLDVTKELVFNPIDEDARGGDTEAYKAFCKISANSVKAHFSEISVHLLNAIKTLDECKDKKLVKFAIKISDISSKHSLKKPVTDDMRKLFSKLIASCADGDLSLMTLVSKRPYEMKGAVFSRGVIVTFPLYNAMKEAYNPNVFEYEFNGVKLTQAQLEIFIAVFEVLIDNLDDDVIAFTSNDKNYPSFIAVVKAYNALMEPMIRVYKEIKDTIAGGTLLNFELDLFKEDELNSLASLSEEMDLLPKEKVSAPVVQDSRSEDNEVINVKASNRPLKEVPAEPVYPYGKPVKSIPTYDRNNQVQNEEIDPVKAALYGGVQQQSYGRYPIMDTEQRYPGNRFQQVNNNQNPFAMGNRVSFPHQNQNPFSNSGVINRSGIRF